MIRSWGWVCLFLIFAEVEIAGQCAIHFKPFKAGEVVDYQVYYNWGFIWVEAGSVEFRTFDKYFENAPCYQFESSGTSMKSYDWLFKVRDKYTAFVDKETLLPLFFERNTSEGGYKAFEQYFFDSDKRKIYGTIKNNDVPFRRDTLELNTCTFDVLSAIYFCRSLDFSSFKINEKVPITTVIDNKIYSIYFKYLGKETIAGHDKKSYRCNKFSALMVEGTIFQGGEDILVWVSEDDNRIPILVEAKILIGSIKAYYKESKGLKYPFTALVPSKP